MNKSNIIRTSYKHDDYGTLRIIYDSGKFLFCAIDICRILEINDHRALSRYCRNIQKCVHSTEGGLHVMNFIDINDVMRLYQHSKSEKAEEFVISIDDIEEDFEKEIFGDEYEDFSEGWDENDDDEDEDIHDEAYLKLVEKSSNDSDTVLIDNEFIDNLSGFLDGLEKINKFVCDLFEDPDNAMKLFLVSEDFNSYIENK